MQGTYFLGYWNSSFCLVKYGHHLVAKLKDEYLFKNQQIDTKFSLNINAINLALSMLFLTLKSREKITPKKVSYASLLRLSNHFKDQQTKICINKLGANLPHTSRTDWKLLSWSKMADRIKESEQNGVKTWVNSQWILIFYQFREAVECIRTKKNSTNDTVLRKV